MRSRFESLTRAARILSPQLGIPHAYALVAWSMLSILFKVSGADALTSPLPAPRTMEVQVLDETTGKPVSGISVMSPNNYKPTSDPAELEKSIPRTDENGKIQITIPPALVPQGHFYLVIQSSNLPSRSLNWSSPAGANIRDLLPTSHTVRLGSRTTVGGIVRDSRGQPVTGARVIVWGYEQNTTGPAQNGNIQFLEQSFLPREMQRAVLTDDTGHWRFDLFPTNLRHVNLDVINSSGSVVSFTTPSPQNFAGVRGIRVDLGSLLATNAILNLKDGVTVRGIVTDKEGKPVPHAVLQEQVGMDMSFLPISITNGPDGHFELKDRTYVRALLRVSAPGYAMALQPVEPKVQSSELRLTLQPAQPVRIQALTAEGKAIEGVRVSAIPHRSGIYAPWEGTTDNKGWSTWSNAPLENLVFWVSSTNYPTPRSVRTSLDKREQTVRLPSGSNAITRIKIRALDDASGQSLASFTVKRKQYAGMQPQSWGEGKLGEFIGELSPLDPQSGMGEGWLIDVDAPGHLGWKSEMIYADAGDQEFLARLREAQPIAGQIRQPDGKPASRASLTLNTQDWGLYSHEPGIFNVSQGGISIKCDTEGKYSLAPFTENPWVVISHPTGFAAMRLTELQKNSTVSLQAWGRVEGVLTIGGQPAKSTSISVRTPLVREGSIAYQANYSQNTDASGRFLFTNLPPGSYVCYRQPFAIMGAPIVESHAFPFDLAPGESKKLELPKSGRLVQGAFQTSEDVDWLNDAHFIELKLPSAPESPQWNDFINPKEFEAARKAYSESAELRKYQQLARHYQLEMDSAGGFRITDVPPGTYLLKVNITKPPPQGQFRTYNTEPIGTLEKEVVIPPGDSPIDLGVSEITIRSDPKKNSAPLELSFLSLDSQPLQLSSFRGKPVVVTLWAEWALTGKEHLLKVDSIRTELKSNDELAFIAVNLDDEETSVKAAGLGIDRQWTQARAQGRSRLALIEQLGVSTLPLTVILDASGRIAARDIPADRLKSILQRTAKKLSASTR